MVFVMALEAESGFMKFARLSLGVEPLLFQVIDHPYCCAVCLMVSLFDLLFMILKLRVSPFVSSGDILAKALRSSIIQLISNV